MNKLLVLALCATLAHAAVRRDAPATPSPLADIEKHAAEFQKTFAEQLNALTNSKNTQDLQKALKEGSDSVLQQLSAFSNSLQGALSDASGKAKEALETSRATIEKSVADLRKAHPEVEQQAAAMREKLQSAVQTAAGQAQQLAKELGDNISQTNEKLAPKVREAYDDFIKHAQEVQAKLHETANKQ